MAHLPLTGWNWIIALSRRRTAVAGCLIIVATFMMSIFAPFLAPYDPNVQDLSNRFQPPSALHWLGTDSHGRDLASRIIWGSRVSLVVAIASILIGTTVGSTAGVVAGYFGGRSDNVLMRATDILMALPAMLLAIAVVAVLGTGLPNLALAIGIANIPQFSRLTRGEVLRVKSLDYIEAARALGASHIRIIIAHLLPNVSSILIVLSSLRVSAAVLAESSLSYLGLGIPPPSPSWGTMVAEGQKFLITAPWLSIAPGAAIGLLVMGLNMFGDGLRDALDPRLRGEAS